MFPVYFMELIITYSLQVHRFVVYALSFLIQTRISHIMLDRHASVHHIQGVPNSCGA